MSCGTAWKDADWTCFELQRKSGAEIGYDWYAAQRNRCAMTRNGVAVI